MRSEVVNGGGRRTAGVALVAGGVLLHPSEFGPAMRSYPSHVPILWPPVPDLPGKTAVIVFAFGLARIGVWLARGR